MKRGLKTNFSHFHLFRVIVVEIINSLKVFTNVNF